MTCEFHLAKFAYRPGTYLIWNCSLFLKVCDLLSSVRCFMPERGPLVSCGDMSPVLANRPTMHDWPCQYSAPTTGDRRPTSPDSPNPFSAYAIFNARTWIAKVRPKRRQPLSFPQQPSPSSFEATPEGPPGNLLMCVPVAALFRGFQLPVARIPLAHPRRVACAFCWHWVLRQATCTTTMSSPNRWSFMAESFCRCRGTKHVSVSTRLLSPLSPWRGSKI